MGSSYICETSGANRHQRQSIMLLVDKEERKFLLISKDTLLVLVYAGCFVVFTTKTLETGWQITYIYCSRF